MTWLDRRTLEGPETGQYLATFATAHPEAIGLTIRLAISLVMVYLVPDTVLAHWIYLVAVALVLVAAYVLFMKKYYHLHEEYLASLKK